MYLRKSSQDPKSFCVKDNILSIRIWGIVAFFCYKAVPLNTSCRSILWSHHSHIYFCNHYNWQAYIIQHVNTRQQGLFYCLADAKYSCGRLTNPAFLCDSSLCRFLTSGLILKHIFRQNSYCKCVKSVNSPDSKQ